MKIILLLCFIFLDACSTFSGVQGNAESIRWDVVETIIPGKTRSEQALKLIGAPSRVENVIVKGSAPSDTWYYSETDQEKLVVSVDLASQIISSVHWNALGVDKTDVLEVKNRFRNGSWRVRVSDLANPHHIPNNCYLDDDIGGVSIQFNHQDNKVISLSRWDTSREPASKRHEQRQKKLKSCIGESCGEYSRSQLDPFCQVGPSKK